MAARRAVAVVSMINLSLHDAATNCSRDGATAILTLRSGVQLSGKLERPSADPLSAHIKTATGWITVLVEEIVAVEARR